MNSCVSTLEENRYPQTSQQVHPITTYDNRTSISGVKLDGDESPFVDDGKADDEVSYCDGDRTKNAI